MATAQEQTPESAYLRLHRATLAHNLPEMLLYASEERKSELLNYAGDPIRLKLVSSMMPRVYAVRSLATSADGTRARMRATGNFSFMGSTAPSFGTIDLVRESGGWKVDKFEWTGDKPPGFDAAVAQSPVRRSAAGALEKVAPAPEPAKPLPPGTEAVPLAGEPPRVVQEAPAAAAAPTAKPAPVPPSAASATASPPPGMVERSRPRGPCEIKPVMTDEDLMNCGATPR